ncbi:hypothetical protein HQ487_02790 [Candidatus Uhrbacteria bacterium]|nr:hypothetical protein [Candidatus Uhrbacteria bacterium]
MRQRIKTILIPFLICGGIVLIWVSYRNASSGSDLQALMIDHSCELDRDCIDVGGGSCSAGCTWPINKNSQDVVRDWLRQQDDDGCYMDCPPYADAVCEEGVCVVYER